MLELPKVLDSKNQERRFNDNNIYTSLIKETNLDAKNAQMIKIDVVRKIFAWNIKPLTSPLIREIVCISLLQHGFIRERFLYTRLGMPFYDVYKDMISDTPEWIKQKKFAERIIFEYESVNKIIAQNGGLNKK